METRYMQIEKELIAVVFACYKFNDSIYGKPVVIETSLDVKTAKIQVDSLQKRKTLPLPSQYPLEHTKTWCLSPKRRTAWVWGNGGSTDICTVAWGTLWAYSCRHHPPDTHLLHWKWMAKTHMQLACRDETIFWFPWQTHYWRQLHHKRKQSSYSYILAFWTSESIAQGTPRCGIHKEKGKGKCILAISKWW